jgi:hypothetical protein
VVTRHALVPGKWLPGQHRVVALGGAGQVVLDQPGQLLKEGKEDSRMRNGQLSYGRRRDEMRQRASNRSLEVVYRAGSEEYTKKAR